MSQPSSPCLVCDVELAPLEALLASTLVLMTAHQRPLAGDTDRAALAQKVVAQLEALATHPLMSDAFQKVAGCLGAQWQARADLDAAAALPERALWLPTPEALQ